MNWSKFFADFMAYPVFAILILTGVFFLTLNFTEGNVPFFGFVMSMSVLGGAVYIGRRVISEVKRLYAVHALVMLLLCLLISLPISIGLASVAASSLSRRLPNNWPANLTSDLMNQLFENSYRIIIAGVFGLFIGLVTYKEPITISVPLPSATKDMSGFSPEQVVADLGQPKQIINLGSKMVYVYSSFKIIFIEGKVADVQ